jgi:hypothetical protein
MHICTEPSLVMQNTSESAFYSLMPMAYGMLHAHGAQAA